MYELTSSFIYRVLFYAQGLEGGLQARPAAHLREPLLLHLCSVYELTSSITHRFYSMHRAWRAGCRRGRRRTCASRCC